MTDKGCLPSLIVLFLISIIISVSASFLSDDIFIISSEAVKKMESYNNQIKEIEAKAMTAFQSGNETMFNAYKKQVDALEIKKKKLHNQTLDKLNNKIGKGISIKIIQKGKTDTISSSNTALITKAVWNPRSQPHVNMELPVTLVRKLSVSEKKFKVIFYDKNNHKVSETLFYLDSGVFSFQLKPGLEVNFYGNPKIFTLKKAEYGVIE